jgi:hypothetical protein
MSIVITVTKTIEDHDGFLSSRSDEDLVELLSDDIADFVDGATVKGIPRQFAYVWSSRVGSNDWYKELYFAADRDWLDEKIRIRKEKTI